MPTPPFCVAKATNVSLFIFLLVLIVVVTNYCYSQSVAVCCTACSFLFSRTCTRICTHEGLQVCCSIGLLRPVFLSLYRYGAVCLWRSWSVSALSYNSTTMNQRRSKNSFLSVHADLPHCMVVSVHFHFCKSLVRCFCVQRKRYFSLPVSLAPCVAAFGADVVACGVPQPLSDPDLPPTFAPKRQGNAPGAYRRPQLRPSFGQPEGIGRPIPLWDCYNRHIPNRRTKQEQSQARLNYVLQGGGRVTLNPSATDFCVLKDTARCPLSNSKGFGLLPKRPCPLRGGLPLRSREACFPTCGAVAGSYAYAVTPLNPL